MEEQGYAIEETEFTDLRSLNIAMQEGDIDVNVDQNLAYIANYNEEVGANLTLITPVPTVPASIHSENKTSIDAVAKGDKVGIPNDASNTARALQLLQKAEWIKLDDTVETMQVTTSDIVENPYELEIVEIDSAQLPRSLVDLDYGVIPGSMLYAAGMSSEDSLLNEDLLPQVVLHGIVNEGNQDTQWAQDIVEAYHSEEFLTALEEVNTDNYWFIPEELQQ